jgi:hypothetical protein
MDCRIAFLAALAGSLLWTTPATAADLPAVRTSERNAVPECATPGRMMAFIKSRNDKLDPRLEKVAVEYMRRGEELGVRWDYAFFQMVIETGYLTFMRDRNRPGLVRPEQNNFAGLGATGKGEKGESFKDVPTGVLAHMQHLLMYTGEPIENPVAERTRKVMEWRVLDAWRAKIKGPMTFAQLAQRWASSSQYASAIEDLADRFYSEFCNIDDPNPEQVREARADALERAKRHAESVAEARPKPGIELARKAIEDGKQEGNDRRSALGGAFLARAGDAAKAENAAEEKETRSGGTPAASGTLNAPKTESESKSATVESKPSTVRTAAAAGALPKPSAPATKCRVWTASYGGQKAVLIRAQADGAVNYTVLDVHDGAEKREADAYIAAYAKGGAIAGEFPSQANALDKAFELCPEG